MNGSCEWIYEYKFETRWLKLAMIKKKFRGNSAFNKCSMFLIEYKKNGHWHSKELK